MKKWKIINKIKDYKNEEEIIKILLENRGLKTEAEIEEFLHPKLESVSVENAGIDRKQLKKAVERIHKAVADKEQVIIFGDYDVDGVTGTAILWETLHKMEAKAMPYIPSRVEEGYGLSVKGISNARLRIPDIKLIITVDNGIVASDAVDFANETGIDVIITDHHTIGKKLPEAFAIVHTTKLCGAGVSYLLSKELDKGSNPAEDLLELAALGTVADLVPLTGPNRTIVKFGLRKLLKTKRLGLLEMFKLAALGDKFGVYEAGFVIGPRLNAAGRVDSAMDSLRLLCTKNKDRAAELASKLELTNRERQSLMKEAAEHAKTKIKDQKEKIKKILVVAHESYQQGIIGLVAGKLVEEFYRPAIVISVGEKYSKASVRSVSGFNIIEFLRSVPEFFVDIGGHPMAAGFTVETEKIELMRTNLEDLAEELIGDDMLIKSLSVDCELPFSCIGKSLYNEIEKLSPFGMANPEPVFASRKVTLENFRILGREGKHLRLNLRQEDSAFEAIAFGMGEKAKELKAGDRIDIAYNIDENTWNGNTKLQLKIKDIK